MTFGELITNLMYATTFGEVDNRQQIFIPVMEDSELTHVPYVRFMEGEKHSGGKAFRVNKYSKNPPKRKDAQHVRLTPYHLEDSIDAHQISVFSHVLHTTRQYGIKASTKVEEPDYLLYALLIAARIHDSGKPVSRLLKQRPNKETGEPFYYFSYEGHNVSGFNLARSAIREQFLQEFFPHFSRETIRKLRLALLMLIYLHQKNEVKDEIFKLIYPILEFMARGKKAEEFLEYLNGLLVSDRRGSVTTTDWTAGEYYLEMPDYLRNPDIRTTIQQPTFNYATSYEEAIAQLLFLWELKERDTLVVSPIGAPGSGKSTFFKKLQAAGKEIGLTVNKVSYDDIRLDMYLEAHPNAKKDLPTRELYDRAHEYAQKNLNELNSRYVKRFKELVESSDIIYTDNTNVTRKNRNRSAQYVKGSKNLVEVFFDLPLSTHISYNEARKDTDKYVGPKVIYNMYLNTLPPSTTRSANIIWLAKDDTRDEN